MRCNEPATSTSRAHRSHAALELACEARQKLTIPRCQLDGQRRRRRDRQGAQTNSQRRRDVCMHGNAPGMLLEMAGSPGAPRARRPPPEPRGWRRLALAEVARKRDREASQPRIAATERAGEGRRSSARPRKDPEELVTWL